MSESRVPRHALQDLPQLDLLKAALDEALSKAQFVGSLLPDSRARDEMIVALGQLRDARQELTKPRLDVPALLAERDRYRVALERIADGCGVGNGIAKSLAERALNGDAP